MADIPLKSDDEMTNDLVGAVENIAQSVKAGSRDFTKSFNGLTAAIKRLQTTLVNAIKSIKVQVVAKPEKPAKQPTKDKATSTKEVVKEKETKTEVKPEPKAKVPKIEKVIDPAEAAKKEKKNKIADESAELRLQTQRNNAQLSALRLQRALTPKPEKKAPEPKPLKETKEERQVRSLGVPGTKKFVGPRLEEEDLANEKAKKDKEQADIAAANAAAKAISDAADAAAKAIEDAAKRKEKAEEDAAKAEKVLRDYFRKKQEKEAQESLKAAQESSKAANDLIKQQEQAAKQLEQANQRTQKELDSMIAGFQGLSSLFRGPLVNYGLKMIAKGIGYKQPKTMSKGGDVSYLADGGQAMKPKGTDTVPAMLTPNEFVVNEPAARNPENRKILESINSGKGRKKTEYHSSGGSVGGVGYYAAGGAVAATAGVAMAAIGVALNSVTKSFAIASEAVSSFASAVQKANPALMEQVGLAMDDLQAVVGRALTPAITMIIPLIRDFADYVDYAAKKFAPSIESIVKISKELMKPLLELGVTIANSLLPFIKLLVLQFGGIVKIIIPIIDLLSSLFETLTLLIQPLGDSEFLFGVFNNSIEILSRAVSIVAGTIQLVIGAFVVGVSKMIEVLGAMIDYIPFSGDAGKSIEGFGEKVGKVGEKLYNKSLENFRAVGEGKPRRFRAGEMSGDKGIEKSSSYGAAVRQASSMSIVGIGDEMRKNALMAGIGQKSQEEFLNQIEKNTGELVDLFKDLKMPQNTGAGRIVGPNPHAPAVVNENMGALPGTAGTRWGAITPIN